jgi:hypothetical protein
MSNFDDREKAQEAKYAQDQEIDFKASARRSKLVGLWAADLMGITGEAADAYAREVIEADFEEAGDEDVFRKVFGDLQAKNVDISEHRVRRQMDDLLDQAKEQILKGS